MRGSKGPLIRIVDDEESVRESLAFMIQQEGLQTVTYPGAREFLTGDSPSVPGLSLIHI